MAGSREKRREFERHSFHEGYMAGTFFVRIAGNVQGPFDAAKLKQLAVAGRISRDDEVSRDRQNWIPAREVKGLVFAAAADSATGITDHAEKGAQPPSPAFDDVISDLGLTAPPGSAPPRVNPPPPVTAGPSLTPPSPTQSSLNLEACPDCRELVSMRAFVCPHCGAPIQPPPPHPEQRFTMLRAIASLYWYTGVLLVIVAAVALLVLFYALLAEDAVTGGPAFGAMLFCIPGAIVSFAICEAIQVFLEIEENTRAVRIVQRHRS